MDKRDLDLLCGLIADHEEWLLDRVVHHAKDRGYLRYTASLREAWRLAVAGLSSALINGLQSLYPDYELKARENYTEDPIAAFAIVASQRHRARGVSMDMFLGLLKYFREGYLDLVCEHGAGLSNDGHSFTVVQRLFDRMEIALCMEWANSSQGDLIDELQTQNQAIVDEKCKYLSIFESFSVPVFVLDENGRTENLNLAAKTMLKEGCRPGEGYYSIVDGKPHQIPEDVCSGDSGVSQRIEFASLFPWLAEDLNRFAGGSDTAARFERSAEGPVGTRHYEVALSRVLDVSEKLTGVIVVLEDVTQKKEDAEQLRRAKEAAEAAVAKSKEIERQREQLQRRLLDASRHAGMAEVAIGVLHNVGNALNSVNVSASIVTETTRGSKTHDLARVVSLINEHANSLATFVTEDERGRHLPRFLATLAQTLSGEQAVVLKELQSLNDNIEHIKTIVSTQQSYAGAFGVVESASLDDLLEDVLRLSVQSFQRHAIQVKRVYAELPPIEVDKQKLLEILINLVRNAKHALVERGGDGRQLTLQTAAVGDERVRIEVIDDGVGIPAENLTRIFAHGFTTKQAKGGRGFGLHHAALGAREMGGSLTAHSDGPGTGATFTLELPMKPAEVTRQLEPTKARTGE